MKRLLLLGSILVLFVGMMSGFADAAGHATPLPPGYTPPASGGGSSGGGSTTRSYSTPTFQEYSEPLEASDGTVIGRLEGKNYNSIFVYAARNATLDGATYALSLEGELTSKPADGRWLDILFPGAVPAGLPPGIENARVYGTVNVTHNPADWSYKGTPKCVLTITSINSTPAAGTDYYLVRADATGYHMQKVAVEASGGSLTVRFAGDAGLYTLLQIVPPAPTPTPTPTPAPTLAPTPVPEDSLTDKLPTLTMFFAVGAVMGSGTIFLFARKGR